MTAIRTNGRAAIACLLALTFAGAVVIQASAASQAEVLLRGGRMVVTPEHAREIIRTIDRAKRGTKFESPAPRG